MKKKTLWERIKEAATKPIFGTGNTRDDKAVAATQEVAEANDIAGMVGLKSALSPAQQLIHAVGEQANARKTMQAQQSAQNKAQNRKRPHRAQKLPQRLAYAFVSKVYRLNPKWTPTNGEPMTLASPGKTYKREDSKGVLRRERRKGNVTARQQRKAFA